MTTTHVRAETPTASVPRTSWMIAASMWLVPVMTGFGITSWIGFALIGVLSGRLRWLALAGLNLWILSRLHIGPEEYFRIVERIARGHWYGDSDLVLAALYFFGILYGVHANRVWLGILWGRHELGKPMLGWRVQPELHRHNPRAAAIAHEKAAAAAAREIAARDALHARFSWGLQQVVAREEGRAARVVAALAQERAAQGAEPSVLPSEVAPSAVLSTPLLTSSPLPMTQLPTGTTTLGLPRGPVDVLTASAAEIASIPGMGAERADALVAARATRTFASVDEVLELLDLPALELLRARPYLGIGPQA